MATYAPCQAWTIQHPNIKNEVWWIFHLKKKSIISLVEHGKEKAIRGAWLFYSSETEEWKRFRLEDYPKTSFWQPVEYNKLKKYWKEQFAENSPFSFDDIAERQLKVWTYYAPMDKKDDDSLETCLEYNDREANDLIRVKRDKKDDSTRGKKEVVSWVFALNKNFLFIKENGQKITGKWIFLNTFNYKWFYYDIDQFPKIEQMVKVEYDRLFKEWERGIFARLAKTIGPRPFKFENIDEDL